MSAGECTIAAQWGWAFNLFLGICLTAIGAGLLSMLLYGASDGITSTSGLIGRKRKRTGDWRDCTEITYLGPLSEPAQLPKRPPTQLPQGRRALITRQIERRRCNDPR